MVKKLLAAIFAVALLAGTAWSADLVFSGGGGGAGAKATTGGKAGGGGGGAAWASDAPGGTGGDAETTAGTAGSPAAGTPDAAAIGEAGGAATAKTGGKGGSAVHGVGALGTEASAGGAGQTVTTDGGGYGGAGGSAEGDWIANFDYYSTNTAILVYGADGAVGGASDDNLGVGGAGGAGGGVVLNLTGSGTVGKLMVIEAGAGGAGGAGADGAAADVGGAGGAGGDAIVNFTGDTLTFKGSGANMLRVTAGSGAADGAAGSAGAGGKGGAGGNAAFNAAETDIILDNAYISLVNGDVGTDGALGGNVTFSAKSVTSAATGSEFTIANVTAAQGVGKYDVSIGTLASTAGNFTVDFGDAVVGANADTIDVGDIVIGAFDAAGASVASTLTLDGVNGTGGNFNWTGKLRVVGSGQTFTEGATAILDLTKAENVLEFDISDVTATATMLTNTSGDADIIVNSATKVNFTPGSGRVEQLGKVLTLVAGGVKGATTLGSATYGIQDSLGNTADVSGNIAVATGDMTFKASTFHAANDWVQGDAASGSLNIDLNATAVGAFSYKVDGTLTLAESSAAAFTGTAGTKNVVDINKLNVAADTISTVTFAATKAAGKAGYDAAANYAKIGDIELMSGSTFGIGGVQGTDFDWTGNLTTNDHVTLTTGLDLSDKLVTAKLSKDYAFSGTNWLITPNATGTIINANTALVLEVDEAARTQVQNGLAVIDGTKVFVRDATGTAVAADLTDAEFDIASGDYSGYGLLNKAGNIAADGIKYFNIDQEVGHTALLAGSAIASLTNTGLDTAEKAASGFMPMQGSAASGKQIGAFGFIGGSHMKVDTGSNVETDSFNLLVGPGLRLSSGTGTTDFGVFFEAGWGNYDAESSYARGEGNSAYYGGGLLLRHETCFGLYGELSARAGGTDTEYDAHAFRVGSGGTDFDSKTVYYGGHIGLGYIARPSDNTAIDFFAKGLWNRVNDDTVDIKNGSGDQMYIDDTDSFRTQLGMKYSYNFANNTTFFAKAAWEHEFDGETAGRYYSAALDSVVDIRKADTGGSSGLAEIGMQWRPTECMTIGASIYGVIGKRQGFGGNVNVGFSF